jgi:16S rRNA (guanine1207-N2)-methyltransferase
LVLNDSFGALAASLAGRFRSAAAAIRSSFQGLEKNLVRNGLAFDAVRDCGE